MPREISSPTQFRCVDWLAARSRRLWQYGTDVSSWAVAPTLSSWGRRKAADHRLLDGTLDAADNGVAHSGPNIRIVDGAQRAEELHEESPIFGAARVRPRWPAAGVAAREQLPDTSLSGRASRDHRPDPWRPAGLVRRSRSCHRAGAGNGTAELGA